MIKRNIFKWVKGRQGGDYEKMLLWVINLKKYGSDCYIIKYEPNAMLKPHIDEVKDGKHLRVNIILKGKGSFQCSKTILDLPRFKIFRPDKHIHSMKNNNTKRIVLSIGFKY